MRVVFFGAWMLTDAAKQPDFLAALAKMTVQDAKPYISLPGIAAQLGALLPDPPGANAAGELRLALLDVAENASGADAASIAYLRKRRTGAAFTNPQQITQALGGASSAATVLEDIKEPSGVAAAAGPAPDPNYNVDLDGDGINDTYVEPKVAEGVTISEATVRAKPDPAAAELGRIVKDTRVNVTGVSFGYTCIEFGPGKKPGFAKSILVFG
jgi:hypothetical protein